MSGTGMNPWLAEIYGTDGADDLEKTAQAHLLQKLAQDNQLDLSQFSPEELQQLLLEAMGDQGQDDQQLQPGQPGYDMNPTQAGFGQPFNAPGQNGQQSGMVHTPQGPQQHPAMAQAFAPAAQPSAQGMAPGAMQGQQGGDMASLQKEAQAKFEEADLLGRVMAHAYTQELEKIAGSKEASWKSRAGLKGMSAGMAHKALGSSGAKRKVVETAGRAAGHASHAAARGGAAAKGVGEHVKKHKGAYGAAAAAGAAGVAAGRMSKEASAFEKLAEMQAAEILGATGFDPATGTDLYAQQQGQVDQGQQGQVDQYTQQGQVDQYGQQAQQPGQVDQYGNPIQGQEGQQDFQSALDDRALELLAEHGYDVNEIISRLNGQAQA